MNHFEIFGLVPTAEIDVRELERRHRELALEFHPDRQDRSDAHARLLALERTSALNDALKVLRDPVRRVSYLLKLQGIDLEHDGPSVAPGFLLEIMEMREQLELLQARGELPRARALADRMAQRKEEALKKATAALARQAPREAAVSLAEIKYLARFIEDVEALEEGTP